MLDVLLQLSTAEMFADTEAKIYKRHCVKSGWVHTTTFHLQHNRTLAISLQTASLTEPTIQNIKNLKPWQRRHFATSPIDTATPQANQRLKTRHVRAEKHNACSGLLRWKKSRDSLPRVMWWWNWWNGNWQPLHPSILTSRFGQAWQRTGHSEAQLQWMTTLRNFGNGKPCSEVGCNVKKVIKQVIKQVWLSNNWWNQCPRSEKSMYYPIGLRTIMCLVHILYVFICV